MRACPAEPRSDGSLRRCHSVETVARSPPDYRKSLRRLSVVRKRRCSVCVGYLSTPYRFTGPARNADPTPNRTHAPSSLQNIRLNSDVANLLSRSQNWRADGDGCVLALLKWCGNAAAAYAPDICRPCYRFTGPAKNADPHPHVDRPPASRARKPV
jgi:hypothetical protein